MAVMDEAPEKRPGAGRIFYRSLLAVRHDPRIFGVFAVTGVIGSLVPTLASNLVQIFGILIGVVISYRSLGGHVTEDSSVKHRTGVALVLVVIMAIPIGVGLLLLALPGLYLIGRLWVAVPAVMIDGAGPLEAMMTSWEATEDTLTAVGSFAAIVVFGGLMLLVPVVQVVSIPVLTGTLASIIVGSLLTAGMAAVYQQFTASGAIGEAKQG